MNGSEEEVSTAHRNAEYGKEKKMKKNSIQ